MKKAFSLSALAVPFCLASLALATVALADELLNSQSELRSYLRDNYGYSDGESFYQEIGSLCLSTSNRAGEWVELGYGFDRPAVRIDEICRISDPYCEGYFFPDNREVWERVRLDIPCDRIDNPDGNSGAGTGK